MPRRTRGESTPWARRRGRELRRRMTPAERRLWACLRDRRLQDLKFRRNHPFGQFVLDMFCVECGLAIEIDGPCHEEDPEQVAYDAARTEFLAEQGVRVIRFTNDEVEKHLPAVLQRISAAAFDPVPLSPVPQFGAGERG